MLEWKNLPESFASRNKIISKSIPPQPWFLSLKISRSIIIKLSLLYTGHNLYTVYYLNIPIYCGSITVHTYNCILSKYVGHSRFPPKAQLSLSPWCIFPPNHKLVDSLFLPKPNNHFFVIYCLKTFIFIIVVHVTHTYVPNTHIITVIFFNVLLLYG